MAKRIPWVVASIVLSLLTAIVLFRSPGGSTIERPPGPNPAGQSPQLGKAGPAVPRTDLPLQTGDPKSQQRGDTSEYVKNAFNCLLDHHRKARNQFEGVATGNNDCLTWRETYGYIQGRLLAICYPDECEKLMASMLATGASPEDMLLATRMLGVLASRGSRSAESALLTVAQSTNPRVACRAMEELFASDKEGRHRALYWTKCLEYVRDAFEFGPYWADEQTKNILEQVCAKYHTPDSPAYRVKESADRMSILESKDRAAKLNQILSLSPDREDVSEVVFARQRWALRVVQLNPTENTVEILKRRLEFDEVMASRQLIESSEPPGPTHPGYVHATRDEYYDEALLAYQALGGKLNEHQSRRLTYYGYLGDPKARLMALLNHEK